MTKDKQPVERIAYRGRTFTIEWYCDASGYSQAANSRKGWAMRRNANWPLLFAAMGDIEGSRIRRSFATKGQNLCLQTEASPFSVVLFEAAKVIVTNAFTKKQDKLPPGEKEKALKCKKDYELRVKARSYYGEG